MQRNLPARPRRARRYSSAALGVLTLLSTAVGTVLTSPAAAEEGPKTYYVSASGGNDANNGESEASPWQSLDKVTEKTFGPGDRILLKAGDSWTGQMLWPKGSGEPGAPIRIDRYGTGVKPRVQGAGDVPDAVKLWNQQYWEIRNLDVSNKKPATATDGAHLGDFRGIHVGGNNGEDLRHFVIDSVDVHDVTGELRWIWGDPANAKPGITFQNGWDRSKNTGGIVFNTSVRNIEAPGTPTVLHDVTLANSTIKNTSFAGIVFKQYKGDALGAVLTGWGARATADDERFTPFTNVNIRGNYLTQHATKYGANGMYLTGIRGGTVERNLVDRVGTSGIELFATDKVTVQYNEVTGTQVRGGGIDANGIDTDIATTGSVVQYNYLHHNVEGYLACACEENTHFGDAVFRYNVVANNSEAAIHLANVSGSTTRVHNNTFYNTGPKMVRREDHDRVGGAAFFSNNIFYTTWSGATMASDPEVKYDNNLYGGTNPVVPAAEANEVEGDPLFVDHNASVTRTDPHKPLLSPGLGWRPAATSPAVHAGTAVPDNGGKDYGGAKVPVVPDMGALQHIPLAATHFRDDFDARPTGPLATEANGWTVNATGNAVDVADTPDSGDKSAHIVRTQDTGGTLGTNLSRTFPTPLTGTVTIEADVMRDDGAGERNFLGLPYLYNSAGGQVVSVGFADGKIVAYSGSELKTIQPYVQGTWYHVKLVVDTAAQNVDLHLNGRSVLTDAPFRTSAPGIARMAFYGNAGNGSAYVNNVVVR
ncbi:right-handed parallel beta-helix repeat-containing protein [Streptomyces cinereoruber]|uniref:right-handed parallel beta-helix repeat-containing protein n=1 Tax=Streptomyces cinereoruber TaxID=67260 RepID=UPI003626E6B2